MREIHRDAERQRKTKDKDFGEATEEWAAVCIQKVMYLRHKTHTAVVQLWVLFKPSGLTLNRYR